MAAPALSAFTTYRALSDEEKPIKLIIKAMPGIQGFIKDKFLNASVNGDATS